MSFYINQFLGEYVKSCANCQRLCQQTTKCKKCEQVYCDSKGCYPNYNYDGICKMCFFDYLIDL